MMQEIFRCIVCLADFATPDEFARHKCPAPRRGA